MKITFNKKDESIKLGDFFLIKEKGSAPQVRQIVSVSGKFVGIDIRDGVCGFKANSIEELVELYKEGYCEVIHIKNSEVEIIIGEE